MMKKQIIYKELAAYYDLIYYWKDYAAEVKKLTKIIRKYRKSRGKELLDVACGTGEHLKFLAEDFFCTGVDINQGALQIAQKKIKMAVFKKADMLSFSLKKEFDVITCLFSAIGYLKTHANLKKAIFNFACHLKKGGVLIVEPWLSKAVYRSGNAHLNTYDGKDIKIARMVVSKRVRNLSIMDMHYLIAEKDKTVRHYVDRHEMGLFDMDKILAYFVKAGLKTEFVKDGFTGERGMVVATKP
ncbi:class I SAM-dependent DNA methyltransferase [Candidatus Riflebacteria bacterium]